MKFFCFIIQISLLCCLINKPVYANRIALLIGNSDYKNDKLKYPVNDATDMSILLKKKGFEILFVKNATKREMTQSIREFINRLYQKKEITGLFYYAGHSVEVEGRNYLIPVKSDISSKEDIEFEGLDMGQILSGMLQSKNNLNIIILDACRSNPYSQSFQTSSRGLAKVTAPKGSLILYATSPGELATDGSGHNSLFTAHLMTSINIEGLTVEQVFKETTLRVSDASNGKQIPWQTGVILREFYFSSKNKEDKAAKAKIEQTSFNKAEIVFWRSIEKSQNPKYFKTYLLDYGRQGRFSALAKLELERLESNTTTRLTINTTPENAKKRILNIEPAYKNGIELKPGEYHIEVTNAGFTKYSQWVELEAGEQKINIVLEDLDKNTKITSKLRKSGLEMVSIPKGCFHRQLTDDNKGEQLVCIDEFKLGKYELTRSEFKKFIRATSYRTEAEWNIAKEGCYSHIDKQWGYFKGLNWRTPGFQQDDTHPISCVSWNDIMIYIDWLNKTTSKHYRLPSETEWEYAARAGISSPSYWNNTSNSACMYANVADKETKKQFDDWNTYDCKDEETNIALVGNYKSNFFGLFDMLGNVGEWTCSKFKKNLNSDTHCTLNNADRVIRGGSWINGTKTLSFDSRLRGNQSNRASFIGFRLAITE